MQPNKDTRSADPYLTWQDLLEAEADDDTPLEDGEENTTQPPLSATGADSWPTTAEVKLPPDVEALLAEKDRLEDELKRLAGFGDPRPEDERLKRMYPVKVHTKESRIEERRLRQHDEHQRLLKQRVLEVRLAQAREQQRQAELEAERRRKAIEQALAKVRLQLRQAEIEAERRRKALEKAQAAFHAAQRQAEREAERERKELEKAAVQARWASDRQKALLKGAQEQRRAARWQEQSLSEHRARASQLARAKKAEQQDAILKDQVQQASVDEAKRAERKEQQEALRIQQARLEKKQEEAMNPVDMRERTSARARSEGLQRLDQQKSQALAWEQARERLRQQALERRREDQALSERLDQRGKNTDR